MNDETPPAGASYSPKESNTDKYRENVTLVISYSSERAIPGDVKDFAEISFSQLRKLMKDCRVMLNKYVVVNGINMYLVILNGIFGKQYRYFKQLFCLYNGAGYMLTYTGEAEKKDAYGIIAGDILTSFKPNTISQK